MSVHCGLHCSPTLDRRTLDFFRLLHCTSTSYRRNRQCRLWPKWVKILRTIRVSADPAHAQAPEHAALFGAHPAQSRLWEVSGWGGSLQRAGLGSGIPVYRELTGNICVFGHQSACLAPEARFRHGITIARAGAYESEVAISLFFPEQGILSAAAGNTGNRNRDFAGAIREAAVFKRALGILQA